MLDDIEDMIKQKLLEDLIDKMGSQSGERLKPKGLAVQVAAPDKEKLSEGLDKAKDVLPSIPESESEEPGGGDDESRLMALLGSEDDDDEDGKHGMR